MTIMTTKLYEIISATQLMHEPWHFVIKVADLYHELKIKTHLIKEDVNNDNNS